MNKLLKKKYQFIKKCKTSKDSKYQEASQKYLKKIIDTFTHEQKTYNWMDLKNKDLNKEDITHGGVYLLYLRDPESGDIIFTYVGESETIYKRWQNHMNKFLKGGDSLYRKIRSKLRSSELSIDDIRFIKLKDEQELNPRLYLETYYIFLFKNKLVSLNGKNVSRRLRCPNGHGNCTASMKPLYSEDNVKPYVEGKCRSKNCKAHFLIH